MNVLYTLCCSYVMYIKQNIIPFKSMILFSLAVQVRLYQGIIRRLSFVSQPCGKYVEQGKASFKSLLQVAAIHVFVL